MINKKLTQLTPFGVRHLILVAVIVEDVIVDPATVVRNPPPAIMEFCDVDAATVVTHAPFRT